MWKILKFRDKSVLKDKANRSQVSPGAWLVVLLPTAIILTSIMHPVSEVYRYCTIYAVNLLLNSVLLLYHIKFYGSVSAIRGMHIGLFVPIICSCAIYYKSGVDMYRAVCYSISNALIYFEAIPYVLKTFPRSFSFGEACVVSQGAALLIFGTFMGLSRLPTFTSPDGDLEIATTIVQVALLTVLLMCLIPHTWSTGRQYTAAGLLLASIIPFLSFLLGFNVINWFLEFLYRGHRLRMVCGWAVCSGFAWGMVVAQIRSHRKAGTDTRKVFHILAVVVFLSGIINEPLLLYLAAGLVFPAFILIEFIRLRKLPPFAEVLQQGFHVYADEKDAGGVALTPIYLLVGCYMPMWLLPKVEGFAFTLPLLAGVLSIGIGDSCASIIGKHFGRQKWSGSNKTIEGSLACAISQVTALLVLTSLGHIPISSISIIHLIKPVVAVCVGSLVEAKTDQIDNLVLPLVTYILLLHVNISN